LQDFSLTGSENQAAAGADRVAAVSFRATARTFARLAGGHPGHKSFVCSRQDVCDPEKYGM